MAANNFRATYSPGKNEDLTEQVRKHALRCLQPALDQFGQLVDRVPAMELWEVASLQEAMIEISHGMSQMQRVGNDAAKTSFSASSNVNNTISSCADHGNKALVAISYVEVNARLRAVHSAEKAAKKARTDAEQIREELQDRLNALDSGLSELRQLNTARTMKFKAENFEQRSKSHKKSARLWLLAALLVTVTMLVIAFVATGKPPLPESDWSIAVNLNYFGLRLLLLSLLSFVLVVCTRNARAQQHNEVSNAHRATALTTFEMFRDAAEDGTVNDVVLAGAVEAIFRPQPTGYSEADRGPSLHTGALAQTLNHGK